MIKSVLIFDNYDSFTQNLYNLIKSTRPSYDYFILRNKDEKVFISEFDVLIISPGPMRPTDTGLLTQLFQQKVIPNSIPVLGVCLGMQFIAEFFGEKITESNHAIHGSAVEIIHNNHDIFANINSPFLAARYNSLEVNPEICSKDMKVLASEKDTNSIMGLRHNIFPFVGVQFHPESFLTQYGQKIIDNFFTQYVEI